MIRINLIRMNENRSVFLYYFMSVTPEIFNSITTWSLIGRIKGSKPIRVLDIFVKIGLKEKGGLEVFGVDVYCQEVRKRYRWK